MFVKTSTVGQCFRTTFRITANRLKPRLQAATIRLFAHRLFVSGDDVTVVLELNDAITDDRNIEIKLSKAVGKKFYKHVYRAPCLRNGNATMPPVCGIFEAGDTISDTVNSDYQEVVYTTIPPVAQVEMAENEVFLSRGQGISS